MKVKERHCGCGAVLSPHKHLCDRCRTVNQKMSHGSAYGVFRLNSRSMDDREIRELIRGKAAILRRQRVAKYQQYAQAGLPIPFEPRVDDHELVIA